MSIGWINMLGARSMILLSRATRSSWSIGAAMTTWALRAQAHLPLPLRNEDVVIRLLLHNLLSVTSHLIRYRIEM
jgi:hypothetical protein